MVDGTYVRLALPRDTAAVAGVQARAWGEAYAELLPAVVLARLEPTAAAQWAEAVERPPTSADHLLVAMTGRGAEEVVVAFAAVSPAEPDDGGPRDVGALQVLAVDPRRLGEGHGSRLLAAVADTLRIDRFARAVAWVPAPDQPQRDFLAGAGWAEDGATRELDMGTQTMTQVRLVTRLQSP